MQTHRILSLGSILAMLLIPVMGWFLVAQPQLAAASAADQQRADIDAQIAESAAVVAKLKADSANLPALEAELDALRGSIPASVDPSGYLDGLGVLAARTGVEISGLTVGEPLAYSPAIPPVDPGAADAAGDAAAEDEQVDAAPPVVVDDPAIVTNALITSENFVAIPVSITVDGAYSHILSFVRGLQTGDRLFLVSTLSVTTSDGDAAKSAAIGGFIYAIPTGVEGTPRPVSTTVKKLDSPETAEEGAAAPEGDQPDGTPTPGPTETPAP
jgi:Tfp pilus assembly protein PilO